MRLCNCIPWWLLILLATISAGCSSERRPVDAGSADSRSEDASDAGDAAAEQDSAADAPFQLGDLIEPFAPPSLAELDKTVEWTNRPVLDGVDRLRAIKAKEPPLVTIEEALAMRNDSPESNHKIISALSVVARSGSNPWRNSGRKRR